eukprot:PLAT10667.3.p1 GENE.PLAT10667.3~~PLAT10667.3.p1  ORF type:complete len:218 (-),score=86.22 PLAT10667.3:289-942(-)
MAEERGASAPSDALAIFTIIAQESCAGNTPDVVLKSMKTMRKVLGNIISSPDVEKFRCLKLSNRVVQEKLLAMSNARTWLELVGFIEVDGILMLPDDVDLTMARSALDAVATVLDASELASEAAGATRSTAPVPRIEELDDEAEARAAAVAERRAAAAEKRRKEKADRAELLRKMELDRVERSSRVSGASVARDVKFGGRVAKWEDIGVDLSKSGGG